MKLKQIFDLQSKLNSELGVPQNLDQPDKISEWTLKMTRSMMHEIIELERSLAYKHWKLQQDIDLDDAREEAIDVLHFLVSTFILLGMTSDDVFDAYLEKNKINLKRIENGY